MMSTIWFVSDIHARIDLLKEAVEHNVKFENGDTFIALGDYVDGQKGNPQCNSFLTLDYLYHLQTTYPKNCYVLMGNHDLWFARFVNKKFPLLYIHLEPQLESIQDFLTNEEFMNIFIDARAHSINQTELLKTIYEKSKRIIAKKYSYLIKWLKTLPYYIETDDFIAVHAGIEELDHGYQEFWKSASHEDTYLMKYPAEKGYFYKTIIAGYVGTASITGEEDNHDICRYRDHIYIDSTVNKSERLNLLKYDTEQKIFTGIKKENNEWVEYMIEDRLKS